MEGSQAYGGVGSRQTPDSILGLMTQLARCLYDAGYKLRSGHATGADQAFERGANSCAEIFLPWDTFQSTVPVQGETFFSPSIDAYRIAQKIHPNWSRLSLPARSLHARNCHQVLGANLDDPILFLLCWTPGAKLIGGTAQAIRLARAYAVPVYNLAKSGTLMMAMDWVRD